MSREVSGNIAARMSDTRPTIGSFDTLAVRRAGGDEGCAAVMQNGTLIPL
jgi:hypothetical protein